MRGKLFEKLMQNDSATVAQLDQLVHSVERSAGDPPARPDTAPDPNRKIKRLLDELLVTDLETAA